MRPLVWGVCASIDPKSSIHFVRSASSASFLAVGPWHRPCWNLARNCLGALSAASKNWTVAVFSDFVSCAACLFRSRIQPDDCKLERRETVMSCRSAARFAACSNPLHASPPYRSLVVRRCHAPESGTTQRNLTAFVMIEHLSWSCRGLCRVASRCSAAVQETLRHQRTRRSEEGSPTTFGSCRGTRNIPDDFWVQPTRSNIPNGFWVQPTWKDCSCDIRGTPTQLECWRDLLHWTQDGRQRPVPSLLLPQPPSELAFRRGALDVT